MISCLSICFDEERNFNLGKCFKTSLTALTESTRTNNCRYGRIVQALYWINLELIAKKIFFADFTSTGPLEHHIKIVSKSILGKLLKIFVLNHRISRICMETRLGNKLLTFKTTCNKNIIETESSARITELFNKQYFKF